ncbi:MAG: putative arginase [Naasia sp.]|jgi:arginase|nr:arginase family protein [Naasia sp.]MCU1569542.1 putative arginase [Naasia sp.]
MRLSDGALAIMGDLPSAKTTLVDVPLGAGEALGTGVARFSSLRQVHDRIRMALAGDPEPAVLIGGDCGVELAGVEHALATGDGRLAVVWLDAHPDLGALGSAPRAFCGTVARAILGEGADGLSGEPALSPDRFVAAGVRLIDDDEQDYLDAHDVRLLRVPELGDGALAEQVAATGATSVYVHVDLDVLDPGQLEGIGDPQPFGLELPALVAELKALVARFPLAGAGIAMFSPESPEAAPGDLPTVLRILSALTSPAQPRAVA